MKRSIYLFLILSLLAGRSVLAQAPTKVIAAKYDNGKPELVNYYKGETSPQNLLKQEKLSVDGKKLMEKNYLNGKLNGSVVEWKDFDGTKMMELSYQEGQLSGKQTYYFSDGKPKMELNYSAGKLEGRQVEYWFKKSQDTLKSEHNYSGGVLQGMQRQWTKEGKNIYNYNFVAGKPEGIQRSWNEAGEMIEERWKQGIFEEWLKNWTASQPKHAKIYDYAAKGDSMNIVLGKNLQKEVWYYETGAMEALTTTSGEIETQIFYLSGKVKGKGKGTFEGKEGKWEFSHQNGKKMMTGEYKAGKQVGLFESWDDNGRLISEEFWNPNGSGRETWKVYRYHGNGNKESEGTLDALGHKKGKWKYWYESGNKKAEEDWDVACTSGKGRPYITNLSLWDDSGRLVAKGSEDAQLLYTYFPNGNPQVIESKIFPNHDACAKGPVEVYKEGSFVAEVEKPADLEKSVVIEKITFFETGDTNRIDRFNEAGKRHGNQEGWFADGKKQYVFHYKDGSVQGSVKEWYATGQIMLDHKYSSVSGGAPSLQEGIYYSDKAKDYPYNAADGKKKKVMEEIDALCYFNKFWQENK
jgi:antitoxin component YwqK of YwqJK toxin-antitoxin module